MDKIILVFIKHCFVDGHVHGDRHNGCNFLQQQFQSCEWVTLLSFMTQLVKLKFRDGVGLNNRFIRAHGLPNRLVHACETLSETLLNAVVLSELPEMFEFLWYKIASTSPGLLPNSETDLSAMKVPHPNEEPVLGVNQWWQSPSRPTSISRNRLPYKRFIEHIQFRKRLWVFLLH